MTQERLKYYICKRHGLIADDITIEFVTTTTPYIEIVSYDPTKKVELAIKYKNLPFLIVIASKAPSSKISMTYRYRKYKFVNNEWMYVTDTPKIGFKRYLINMEKEYKISLLIDKL